MAEKVILDYDNQEVRNYLKGEIHFYGITSDVGWGCTNHWADVMLVQYMLGAAYGVDGLVCDGVFGPKTAKAIKGWQKVYGPEKVKNDGKVDAVDGAKLRSSISKTIYTMLALNEEFVKYMPLKYKNIKADPKFPTRLLGEVCIKGKSGGSGGLKGQPQTQVN